MKKIVAVFVLCFGMVPWAQANVITLHNWDLIWYEGTNEHGGLAKIVDQDGLIDPFQIMIRDFSAAWEQDGPRTIKGFITPLIGGDVTFQRVNLIGIFGKERNQFELSTGTGYSEESSVPFFHTQFRESDGNSWDVYRVSEISEPPSVSTMLAGLALFFIARKRRAKARQQGQET